MILSKGHPEHVHPFVHEYMKRMGLKELGFTFDAANVSARKAEAFLFIKKEVDAFYDKKKAGKR